MLNESSDQFDLLQQRLLQRFCDNKLAHFYILRPHPHESEPQKALHNWIESFLKRAWETEKEQETESFTQHPDFLVIENPKPERAYQSRENPGLVEWAKTQDYGPMELKRRWIVVHHADTLTESFCHKQLKTLEEPNADTTIIFTAQEQSPLLKTIESRAINIQIPSASWPRTLGRIHEEHSFSAYLRSLSDTQSQEFAQFLEGPVHETLDWLRSRPELERPVLEWVLDFERSRSKALQLHALLQRLKWFQKSALLHNSAQERWLTLLSPYFAESNKG